MHLLTYRPEPEFPSACIGRGGAPQLADGRGSVALQSAGASVNVACIFVGLMTDIVGGIFTVDADENGQRCFWLWS